MNTTAKTFMRFVLATAAMLTMGAPTPGSRAMGMGTTPKEPTANDKCPVCGMFVKPYPRWWTGLIYEDGTVVYFDGSKDMFKYYLKPDAFGGTKGKKISAIYVRDYYTLTWMDAREAFYVIDSDIYGPMGHELVPLATQEDAREFRQDHHGSAILQFNDIDWQILLRLSLGENM